MAGQAGLAGARKPEEQEAPVLEQAIPLDPDHLRPGMQPETAPLLYRIHELAQHSLLVFPFVVGAQDYGQPLLEENHDPSLRPFGDGDSYEIGIVVLVFLLEERIAPHQRYACVLGSYIDAGVEKEIRVHAHTPIELDDFLILEVIENVLHQLQVFSTPL